MSQLKKNMRDRGSFCSYSGIYNPAKVSLIQHRQIYIHIMLNNQQLSLKGYMLRPADFKLRYVCFGENNFKEIISILCFTCTLSKIWSPENIHASCFKKGRLKLSFILPSYNGTLILSAKIPGFQNNRTIQNISVSVQKLND